MIGHERRKVIAPPICPKRSLPSRRHIGGSYQSSLKHYGILAETANHMANRELFGANLSRQACEANCRVRSASPSGYAVLACALDMSSTSSYRPWKLFGRQAQQTQRPFRPSLPDGYAKKTARRA
mmetsp:Transcript_2445/g.7803  ORF Transcript_2445/g.7803 Transcript_2445/m.7803 type:complete len:125 (-) Transcript_2445:849-1223(-)